MPRISSKNQVTLPVRVLEEAGLSAGDEVIVESDGEDRVVVRRADSDFRRAFGIFHGLYEPGHLDRLRAGERA